MTKTQHCFSFWKGNHVVFFSLRPLAKDAIPSGESYVYLTISTVLWQDKGPLLHFLYLTLFFIPSAVLRWRNYKVVKNKQGQREQTQGEFVVN